MSTNLLQLPHELSDAKLTALTLMIDNQINTLQIKADISTLRDTSLKKYLSSLRSHFKKIFTAEIPRIKQLNHAR